MKLITRIILFFIAGFGIYAMGRILSEPVFELPYFILAAVVFLVAFIQGFKS